MKLLKYEEVRLSRKVQFVNFYLEQKFFSCSLQELQEEL